MIPTIGRTVLYVMPEGHNHCGDHRPAIVVIAWSAAPDAACNLHVFIDPANDGPLPGGEQCSVAYDPTGKAPRSWHWPTSARGTTPAPGGFVHQA